MQTRIEGIKYSPRGSVCEIIFEGLNTVDTRRINFNLLSEEFAIPDPIFEAPELTEGTEILKIETKQPLSEIQLSSTCDLIDHI
jgi:hypothetical protein